jgi:hypothetical protein
MTLVIALVMTLVMTLVMALVMTLVMAPVMTLVMAPVITLVMAPVMTLVGWEKCHRSGGENVTLSAAKGAEIRPVLPHLMRFSATDLARSSSILA